MISTDMKMYVISKYELIISIIYIDYLSAWAQRFFLTTIRIFTHIPDGYSSVLYLVSCGNYLTRFAM
ncbi:MAG: hypothetical protein ACJAYN_002324 [Bermanella sp.]|jgi:hypothetical protein